MTIREILERCLDDRSRRASRNPSKAAGGVPLYLKEIGFRVIPVNPNAAELYGVKAHSSLLEIDERPWTWCRCSGRAKKRPRSHAKRGSAQGHSGCSSASRRLKRGASPRKPGLAYVEDRCMAVENDDLGIRKMRVA
jgi:uncharacterized protein